MWVALFVHWPRLDAVQEHVDRMTFPAWLQQVWLWVEWCMESMPFFPDRTGSNYLDKQTYSSLRFDHDGSFIAVNGHNSIIPPGGFEWFKGIVFFHAILLMEAATLRVVTSPIPSLLLVVSPVCGISIPLYTWRDRISMYSYCVYTWTVTSTDHSIQRTIHRYTILIYITRWCPIVS